MHSKENTYTLPGFYTPAGTYTSIFSQQPKDIHQPSKTEGSISFNKWINEIATDFLNTTFPHWALWGLQKQKNQSFSQLALRTAHNVFGWSFKNKWTCFYIVKKGLWNLKKLWWSKKKNPLMITTHIGKESFLHRGVSWTATSCLYRFNNYILDNRILVQLPGPRVRSALTHAQRRRFCSNKRR